LTTNCAGEGEWWGVISKVISSCFGGNDILAKIAVGEEVANMMKHLRTIKTEAARKLFNELLFFAAPSSGNASNAKSVAKLLEMNRIPPLHLATHPM
jgi:hypothetical protein